MSSELEHINQYKHNVNFYNSAPTSKYLDWAIVILFYESVHLIESIMAQSNEHSNSHEARKIFMQDHREIFTRDLMKSYWSIEGLSKKARYLHSDAISDVDVNMAAEYLDEITAWCKSHSNLL